MKRKINLDSKPAKYFHALRTGRAKTKAEASTLAGYRSENHASRIEQTQTYQELEKVYFKDELLKQTSLVNLAKELLKNVEQDQDRGAKNKAIEIALKKIEPETNTSEEEDRVLVILR